ncbi:MAG: hypothetical protein ABEN55_16050 [Bradymonadaceae bacterium]
MERWAPQHVTAAQMRARGQGWPEVADETGYAHSTVRDYTTIPGFSDLVDHFREKLRSERLEEHWHEGVGEALEVQRQAIEGLKARVETLRGQIVAGEADEDDVAEFCALTDQIQRVTDKYLSNLGFAKSQKVKRKLEAQEDVHGEPGERLNIKQALEDRDDADADRLSKEYRQLVDAGEE